VSGIVNINDIKHKILFKRILDFNVKNIQSKHIQTIKILLGYIKWISIFFTYNDKFIERVLTDSLTENEKQKIKLPTENSKEKRVASLLNEMLDELTRKEQADSYQKNTNQQYNAIKSKDDGNVELYENDNDDALLVYRILQKKVFLIVDILQRLNYKYKQKHENHVNSLEKFKSKTTTENLIKDYKHFFSQFVFKKDSNALGIGAFIISLIVIHVTPYHDEIMNTYLSLSTDLPPFLGSLLEKDEKTDPFQSLSLNYNSVISNINKLTNTTSSSANGINKNTKCVEAFHQKPFLLGLYAFLIEQNTGGTCQDNTLIQLISDDKQNKLSGFSIAGNHEDISHWFNNACSNNYNNHIRVSNIVRPNSALGKRVNGNVISEQLFKANTSTPIDQNNYDTRAKLFLLMTLSHVYRHTLFSDDKNIELVNYKNGIAFDQNFVPNLIDSIKNESYSIIPNSTRSKNTNSIEQHKLDINCELIIKILNRNVQNIKNCIKTQNVSDDFDLNIQLDDLDIQLDDLNIQLGGGKRNPFDSLIKAHIDTIKNKRDLKRFVKDAIKNDPKLQNKIINYYLTHEV